MATSLEALEQRLAAVERELARLRDLVEGPAVAATPLERGVRLMRKSRRSQAQASATWKKVMEEMGIKGEPIPAEKLHEMMAAAGLHPDGTEFSRGIIEMREE
jgi:hypothetical protein